MTDMKLPSDAVKASANSPHMPDQGGLRHELVDAQVQVLSSYLDKRSPEQLVAALDRLIDCCRASFHEEEALMIRLGGQPDPAHHQRHEIVMKQLSELRLTAMATDRGRLLASLILIDRELIAHVAEAAQVQAGEGGLGSVDLEAHIEPQH